MQAGHDVFIELPLATTLADARRIIAAQRATGRRAFVDMFSRFSPANQRAAQAMEEVDSEGTHVRSASCRCEEGLRSQVPALPDARDHHASRAGC